MIFWIIAFSILVIDQLTKHIVKAKMELSQSTPIIENVFHITYVENPGAAFGILAHRTVFFIIITAVVGLAIIYFNSKLPKDKWLVKSALAMQLGGAVGNLIDRVNTGYVVDFLDFRIWPVFNIADIGIVVGVILLAILLWNDENVFITDK
ncbi:signal peptidase II [Desulfitispora alkaliphila]|uniref:signal peptidase II n=1 Tax=Desulfitispora alkaliphila TaxID=622674 RepID=UPI003D211464